MSNALRDPFPFPEKAKELQALLRARLEGELAEAHHYFGDSLDRPLVLPEPRPRPGEGLEEAEGLPGANPEPWEVAWVDPTRWPEGLPLPLTVGEALAVVERDTQALVVATAEELSGCARILAEPKLLEAVLSRAEVARAWPWPAGCFGPRESACAVRTTWYHLHRAFETPRWGWPVYWPKEAAPGPVARWAQERLERYARRLPEPLAAREVQGQVREMVRCTDSGHGMGDLSWTGADGGPVSCPAAGMALLYLAEQEVQKGLRRPAVAIDAGRHHHELVTRWRDLPKDVRRPHELSVRDGRLELLVPGQAIQLTLPLDCDDLNETMVHAIREWRGPMGLRHWAAIQRLLSIEGGRQGWVRWTLEGHLQALGYSASARTRQETRARVAAEVELLTRAELAVLDKHGQIRERRPLLHVGTKFDRLEGSQWTLDGMELRINPWLYRGVRDEASGKLGSNWYPAPPELAQIDHQRYQYAIALGLVLPIRFRWAWAEEGKDHLVLTGKNLLTAAGIPYNPQEPGRTWEKLERNLKELQRIQGLGRWEWETGAENTLSGLCRLYPAAWQLDRTLHGLTPLELPPGPSVLTGNELKAWRKARGWTQAEAASRLGVSQYTISVAEAKKAGAISDALALKVRALK